MRQPTGTRQKIKSLSLRIELLRDLRGSVGLPAEFDATEKQWSLLSSQLGSEADKLRQRLKKAVAAFGLSQADLKSRRGLQYELGQIELDLANGFTFFDTYFDALTQRHAPELGKMLRGCETIAADAMRGSHAALDVVERPLVFCNRGFGAAIIRERVSLPGRAPNPMPLIQIPYSRLKQKLLLTSILHEAGHQALVQLGLVDAICKAIALELLKAGAPRKLAKLFSLWSSELAPDFWAFCLSGLAQPTSMLELLGLPQRHAVFITGTDPHPPPVIRVLVALQWCRQLWGSGDWDEWEKEWRLLYPLKSLSGKQKAIMAEAMTFIPVVSDIFFSTRFQSLGELALPSLFNLESIHPRAIANRIVDQRIVNLDGLRPASHLAVFRTLQNRNRIDELTLDSLMSKWLIELGKRPALGEAKATGTGQRRN